MNEYIFAVYCKPYYISKILASNNGAPEPVGGMIMHVSWFQRIPEQNSVHSHHAG